MANPHKGEVALAAAGATYMLVYSADALCQLEDLLGRGIIDISLEIMSWGPKLDAEGRPLPETPDAALKRVQAIRMTTVRALLWAGLQEHHPDVDLKAAGTLMIAAGGLDGVMPKIGAAFALAFPEAETSAAHPPQRRPARTGRGRAS